MTETNNNIEGQDNFEEMFEQSLHRKDFFEIGDEVSGTVVSASNDAIFVDISGKSDAMINTSEFADDQGQIHVKTGDPVRGYIVTVKSGETFITGKIGMGYMSQELLNKAYSQNLPVYGRVIETTKGGFIVSLPGVHCFCPLSQIDMKTPSKPDEYLDRTFEFKISELGGKGKNVVLSRRSLLENRRDRQEKELKKSLKVGDTVRGTIESKQNFGLFVDIGGFQALVPKSETSWSRQGDLSGFTVGSEIDAMVKFIDWDNKKITLSIKDLSGEPWNDIGKFSPGDRVTGKVVNIIKSGVFVELSPGIEGFIHISNLSSLKKILTPEDAVSRGDTVTVRILDIKPNDKRISLELITGEADPWQGPADVILDTIHEAVVETVKPNGVNARLANGMLGFIPREELSLKKASDLQQEYAVGKTLKVTVKKMDASSKKMILTEEGALRKAEEKEYRQFVKDESVANTSSLGSLLKDKFEKIKKDIEK